MSSNPLTQLEIKCAELLRVPANVPQTKRRGLMNARLRALGHSTPCGRCGGSGNYSFNAMDGTRCYGCAGAGGKPPKVTPALLRSVEKGVQAGALDRYLLQLRTLNAARQAPARVLEAWSNSGVRQAYSWMKASDRTEPDWSISRLINQPMCEAYEQVKGLSSQLEKIAFKLKKVTTAEAREALERERVALSERIVEETDQALALIDRLASTIPLVRQRAPEGHSEASPAP